MHRNRWKLFFALFEAAVGIGSLSLCADLAWAGSFDTKIEQYRTRLIADVDGTLSGVKILRERAAAGDFEAAKRAWIAARVGWERSEVFTMGFVPDLDEKIDAWPNGTTGFHAVEARLFGANRIDFDREASQLERNVFELRNRAGGTPLTSQGLFNGIVQLVYEVGDSKVDGGESRLSGTSLYDMRNNMDGIELAYETIFAAALADLDRDLNEDVRRSITELKAMLALHDLRRVDSDALRTMTEDLVLKLQRAAPILQLQQATLEASVR